MSVAPLAVSDLDRTLVFSPSALALPGPDEEAPTLVCVEVHEGRPLSFTTLDAHHDLAALTGAGVLVPVTTRTVAQYRRIRLPGPPPRFAVCANGGRLLVDGTEDADWSRHVAQQVSASAPVAEVAAGLARLTEDDEQVVKRRTAEDLFCYLVLRGGTDPAPLARAVEDLGAPRGWVVSVQGRKIYVLPRGLTKVSALGEVLERAGASAWVAAGDAHLDAGMLDAAREGLVPLGSELDASGWTRDHVGRTTAAGVLAGQEVAAWLRGRAVTVDR